MTRLAPLLVLALSCTGEPVLDCYDDGDCEGLAVCGTEGTCREVECLDSSQCALGTHCNTDANVCFTGCEDSDDCLSGEVCDTSTTQCVPGLCSDTDADCYIGQECNAESGECDLPGMLCMECTGAAYTDCVLADGVCRYQGGTSYCLTACDPVAAEEDGGPRGFTCLEYYAGSEEYVWYGDCALAVTAPNLDDDEE